MRLINVNNTWLNIDSIESFSTEATGSSQSVVTTIRTTTGAYHRVFYVTSDDITSLIHEAVDQ